MKTKKSTEKEKQRREGEHSCTFMYSCQGIGNKGNKGGNEKKKKKDEDKFKG